MSSEYGTSPKQLSASPWAHSQISRGGGFGVLLHGKEAIDRAICDHTLQSAFEHQEEAASINQDCESSPEGSPNDDSREMEGDNDIDEEEDSVAELVPLSSASMQRGKNVQQQGVKATSMRRGTFFGTFTPEEAAKKKWLFQAPSQTTGDDDLPPRPRTAPEKISAGRSDRAPLETLKPTGGQRPNTAPTPSGQTRRRPRNAKPNSLGIGKLADTTRVAGHEWMSLHQRSFTFGHDDTFTASVGRASMTNLAYNP